MSSEALFAAKIVRAENGKQAVTAILGCNDTMNLARDDVKHRSGRFALSEQSVLLQKCCRRQLETEFLRRCQ